MFTKVSTRITGAIVIDRGSTKRRHKLLDSKEINDRPFEAWNGNWDF
jgi:hypothetical protein